MQRRAADAEPARRQADHAIGDHDAKRAADPPLVVSERHQRHPPFQRRAALRVRDQVDIQRTGPLEHHFYMFHQALAVGKLEEGPQRHPPHIHPHQLRQVLPREAKPHGSGAQVIKDEGIAQRLPDVARIDIGAARHGGALAQSFPVSDEIADDRIDHGIPALPEGNDIVLCHSISAHHFSAPTKTMPQLRVSHWRHTWPCVNARREILTRFLITR